VSNHKLIIVKKQLRLKSKVKWLDRQYDNGTLSIEDYDPNFNMEEVLNVLDEINTEDES
jgi:hypothetical protein